MNRDVKFIAIHCSASKPAADLTAADIDAMHKRNGWSGIGYHFVIRRNGDVQLGRPLDDDHVLEPNEVGAHVAGFNKDSVGVCLVGGLDSAGRAVNNFTDAQWASLDLVVRGLKHRWPKATVQGHRDFPGVAKDCPCFDVRAWLAKQGIAA